VRGTSRSWPHGNLSFVIRATNAPLPKST
jgi:hypothetical protein